MREFQEKGVRGFRIYPKDRPLENWLGSDGMRKMWAVGTDQKLAMCCLMDVNGLAALDRMGLEFPETPVIVDHMCRIGTTGHVDPKDVESLCAMSKHKQLTVKVSAFYALGKKKPPYHDLAELIQRLFDAFGPERLMWASDAPFQVVGGHTYKASIDLVQSGLGFLNATDLEWLLRKTSERVFFH
jgi:predicted TIM-barrel fold metal-dependent hydrolase